MKINSLYPEKLMIDVGVYQNKQLNSFSKELCTLINKYSIENFCDMPDFMLSKMICDMIKAMGPNIKQTLDWHGCKSVCHSIDEQNTTSLEINVDYDGSWPNLCSGNLVVEVNGKKYRFPRHCLVSGGNVIVKRGEINHGRWSVSDWPEDMPDNIKDQVLGAINDHIPHGCCGGCL